MEQEIRDSAFLDINEDISGIPVKPLTIDHLIILDAVKSPFTVYGKEVTPEQIAIFLWIVSPQFRVFSDDPKQCRIDQAVHRAYIKSLRKVKFDEVFAGIMAYLDAAFFDRPKGGSISKASYCSWIASIVSIVHEKTGWPPEKVRSIPLKQVWQFVRAATTGTQFNPSDRIRSEWLEKLNRGEITLAQPSNQEPA